MTHQVRYVVLAALILVTALSLVWLLQTPPAPPTPNYAVIYRSKVSKSGRTEGHVVVRSLSRRNEHREQICRDIASVERLDVALFFSTCPPSLSG